MFCGEQLRNDLEALVSPGEVFFPCSAFLGNFSLCQDQLSGDASDLGGALLCSSRAGSVYLFITMC